MNSGISVKFDAGDHVVVVLLGLGAILVIVLPLARMPLLKSHCQCATDVLPSCVCCLAHLCQNIYSKRQLRKNHNLGTARSKMVLNGHDVVQKR